MHVILTGATGLVGSSVLDAMIKTKDITKISILSRKPVKMAQAAQDPRINVILHQDFESYSPSLLQQLEGAKACVWALGISQTKVTKDEYVKITRDYTLAAARSFATLPAAAGNSEPFRFIYVSGEGATQTPGFFSAVFARVKGQTERELSELMAADGNGKLRVDSVRPAYVDARGHEAIQAYVPDPGRLLRAAELLASPMVKVMPGMHSPTPVLGEFLTRMAMGGMDDKLEGVGAFKLGPSWIIANVGLRRMMGL